MAACRDSKVMPDRVDGDRLNAVLIAPLDKAPLGHRPIIREPADDRTRMPLFGLAGRRGPTSQTDPKKDARQPFRPWVGTKDLGNTKTKVPGHGTVRAVPGLGIALRGLYVLARADVRESA